MGDALIRKESRDHAGFPYLKRDKVLYLRGIIP